LFTKRLREHVTAWWDIDADIDDVTDYLHTFPEDGFSRWLQDDLRQAIEDHDLTPTSIGTLTNRRFDSQTDLDDWLRDRWTTWFPGDIFPRYERGS